MFTEVSKTSGPRPEISSSPTENIVSQAGGGAEIPVIKAEQGGNFQIVEGVRPARFAGSVVYGVGVALMVLPYFWAAAAFPHTTLAQSASIQPMTVYTGWSLRQLFFILPILLMTLIGWTIAGRGAQMVCATCTAETSKAARTFGILVFILGACMIALVFIWASQFFATTPSAVPEPAAHAKVLPDYLAWAISWIFRILVLALMAFNGSLVTSRGVTLFLAALPDRKT